jgi:hypothetical protein
MVHSYRSSSSLTLESFAESILSQKRIPVSVARFDVSIECGGRVQSIYFETRFIGMSLLAGRDAWCTEVTFRVAFDTGTMERQPLGQSDAPNRSNANESEEWSLPIYHEVCWFASPTLTTQNLCDIVDELNVFNKVAYRFCRTKYDLSKEGRNKLERSLIDAAKDSSGLELVVASGIGAADKTGARRAYVLQCDCSLYYKSIKYDQENNIVNPSNAPHKRSSLHNDGVNKRSAKQGGRTANHRRDTKRVLDRKGEGSCKFRIPVYVDSDGYFIKGRVGCSMHSRHLRPCREVAALTNSTRHLPEEQRKSLQSVAQARAGAAVAANVLYEMYGTHVSVNQSRGVGNPKRSLNDSDDALQTLLMEHKSLGVFLYQGKTKDPSYQGAVIDTLTNEISDVTNGQMTTVLQPAILEPTEIASVHDYTNRVRLSPRRPRDHGGVCLGSSIRDEMVLTFPIRYAP